MKIQARATHIRQAPSKVRQVLDQVRGLPVEEARHVLAFTNRRASTTVSKVLESAVANASHNHSLDPDELRVVAAFADEGPVLKRFKARARGRASSILKRTSHITIVVGDERDEEEEEMA
jgi:large subunit ribosomal protein L22